MGLTDKQTKLLDSPLDSKRISNRSQGGQKLKYLEGWDIIATANKIFGFDGWQRGITTLTKTIDRTFKKDGKDGIEVGYQCIYWVEAQGQRVEDVGYGTGISYGSPNASHELAVKEAVTDAMKRCLRSWGEQFGNSLYNKDHTPQETPKWITETKHKQLEALIKQKLGKEEKHRDGIRQAVANMRKLDSKEGIHLNEITNAEHKALTTELKQREDK